MSQLLVSLLGWSGRLNLLAFVHHEALLSGHRIEDAVKARGAGNLLDDGLHTILQLLVVEPVGRRCGRLKVMLLAHAASKVEILHSLLSHRQVHELLLE